MIGCELSMNWMLIYLFLLTFTELFKAHTLTIRANNRRDCGAEKPSKRVPRYLGLVETLLYILETIIRHCRTPET